MLSSFSSFTSFFLLNPQNFDKLSANCRSHPLLGDVLVQVYKGTNTEQRQTKQLCLRNVAFIKDGEIIDHSSTSLHFADGVSITFEQQKNYRKANTVTQWRTSDYLPCPVVCGALILTRNLSCKGANKNSPVFLVKNKNKIIDMTAEMIANLCRDRVTAISEMKLSILQSEIGTRYIHLGAVMAMHLAGVPVFSIMLQMMVKQGVPENHQETGPGVLGRHLLKNYRNTVVQTHSKSHRNKPDGQHSWQLVFVANGIKLTKEASLLKGQGRG